MIMRLSWSDQGPSRGPTKIRVQNRRTVLDTPLPRRKTRAHEPRQFSLNRAASMKTKLKRFHARLFCGVTLGIGSALSLAAAPEDSAGTVPAKTSIPWSQIGAKAGADYQGDGLAIIPTADGARLRCVSQRLEGEITLEGLWLTSTVSNAVNDRFRVVAAAARRQSSIVGAEVTKLTSCIHPEPRYVRSYKKEGIADTGAVAIDGQIVRVTRPGLVEEYAVGMDGVRQDFVVLERPAGAGELEVRLAVSGARVEPTAFGAQLVLEKSGRKIAYSRSRVTDATGKELTARMEVTGLIESQRDSIAQPRVASRRATLGHVKRERTTLKGLRPGANPGPNPQRYDATPVGLKIISRITPRVGAGRANPGLDDPIPSGLNEIDTDFAFMASAEARAPMLTVVVNDADAVYPVRIDPTFSDANWISMGGANGAVSAAVLDGSGNLYIGGYFTAVGNVIANRVAKWTGTSWMALGSGIGGNNNPYVYALAVSGSDLYAGGRFTTAGGSVANYIAKWNGNKS
jgi:hypothetical protein